MPWMCSPASSRCWPTGVATFRPRFVSERANDLADLLEEAARACAERDRRLLVLIDGLDEYDPTTTSLDLADWLPDASTLPDQAMLLVASRAGADVRLPSAHPLFELRAAHHRLRSCYRDPARRARGTRAGPEGSRRIRFSPRLLSGGRRRRADGQRTACLAETARPRRGRQRDRSTARQFPRPQSHAPSRPRDGTGAQVYAFAHDTLLTEARSRFASDLATYEDLLDEWADDYAHVDWPVDTPRYLLRPYTRELTRRAHDPATPDARRTTAMIGALDRLSALARSPSRHAFLLRATGSDYAALVEIRNAQKLIAAKRPLITAGSRRVVHLPERDLQPQRSYANHAALCLGTAWPF